MTPMSMSRALPIDLEPPQDFSVVLGGPLFQLLRRTHLTGNALELLRQRILIFVALVWVPLFTLSVAEGRAWSGRAAVPFLKPRLVNSPLESL